MRFRCPILVLLAALSARADVIHLKNGRTIWADQVREDKNKDRVEYDVGEDTYAIPKSSIDRIDAGGGRTCPFGSGRSAAVPDFTPPAPTFQQAEDVAGKGYSRRQGGYGGAGRAGTGGEIPKSPPRDTFWPASSNRIMGTFRRPSTITSPLCAFSPIIRPC